MKRKECVRNIDTKLMNILVNICLFTAPTKFKRPSKFEESISVSSCSVGEIKVV